MEEDNACADFKDIETKLGRKVPKILIQSLTEGDLGKTKDERNPAQMAVSDSVESNDLKRLESKILFLKQEMAHLRAIDIKLMQQLLTINDGIESIKWVMEERGALASRDGSLTGSLDSLSESPGTSLRSSCNSLQDRSDGLDGISVGSYLDTLAEDLSGHTSPSDLDRFSDSPGCEGALDMPDLQTELRADIDEYYCFG